MGKINVLSFAVANLIAAGEVVDRPASVIKELLENAIDAGARHVTVEIRNGGVTFMRVTDDGCGIAPEDLPVAIKRHATSKIREADDLDGILTLGFRGEALAAIAAVSDLRIITRTADAPYGSLLVSHGGEVEEITEQGAPVGTTVIVENLFANVPARRKFLKKDVSEAIAVSTYVEKIALSRPDIAIRLIIDGNMKLDTAGDGKVQSAMYAVFGREFVSKMIPVEGGDEHIKVGGYIGRPDNVRPKRNYENFFINGRYINCRTAAAALEQAYTSFIPLEKFPCCVLYIDINPAAVDVNVHPAKLEVKFSNEKPVFEAVYYAVRSALESNSVRPAMQLKTPMQSAVSAFVPVEEGKRESLASRQISIASIEPHVSVPSLRTGSTAPKAPDPFVRMSAAEYANRYTGGSSLGASSAFRPKGNPTPSEEIPISKLLEKVEPKNASTATPDSRSKQPTAPTKDEVPAVTPRNQTAVVEEASVAQSATLAEEPVEVMPWRIVGEVFHAYVVVECGDKMLLIDKHAAHERVLFEQLRANMKHRNEVSQILMIPMNLSLSRGDVETLEFYKTEIAAIGFSYVTNDYGLSVSEIPEGLAPAAAGELLTALAVHLHEGTGSAALARDIVFEKALYQGACKAAIKAGREYPPEYIAWLCDQLQKIPDITVCPHGRPVAMELTHAYIDHQFKRS
ncbi:MAG: DNA mismatch repair endonuclease MutL [Clostridia bacterium]|nr:DNA mismatch repair endonuclease MutL [Clostridia bacterium]